MRKCMVYIVTPEIFWFFVAVLHVMIGQSDQGKMSTDDLFQVENLHLLVLFYNFVKNGLHNYYSLGLKCG